MGIKRLLWRSTGIGRVIDTAKNIRDEYSVVDGIKRTIKEDYYEDNPITSAIYEAGKYDGKAQGYEKASDEYKEKLLKQGNEFLKQTNNFKNMKAEYEKLLDEYEKVIDELERKSNRTELENEYLRRLLSKERELRKKIV